ncbi:MAG: hypothetical protein Q9199_007379, partial [Rusavskia elegans]
AVTMAFARIVCGVGVQPLLQINPFYPRSTIVRSTGSTSPAATLDPGAQGNGCIAYDPLAPPPTYAYDPILVAGVTFTVLFFLSMCGHV